MTEPDGRPPEGDLLMGADAIARFLGISRRQVYRLANDGIMPSFKLGGTVAARRSSLTRWLEDLEKRPAGD
ncbi:helix-turn-helix domain-containing protein [Shinella sp. CPCC 100929]|uniref:Helix-turn-helix domain-containing protein n=1 Tax=Shinella lacus TaxID=2654216 RepID=A0ABT1R9E2_9HYPH|nr:helix-turn-helix domain-containing protein [Shinella lacus]MCQ4631676.1 helix-turn-helix domain-containing protein [Shinella lacus]